VLAGRLGVSVDDLAPGERSHQAQEAALLQAETELARGSAERALKLALEQRTAPSRARLLRLRGRALLKLDRPREALEPLNGALAEFRLEHRSDLAGRTLYDIAIAHARLDESEEAIMSALECERALKAGELIDATVELQVRTLLAAAYVRRGDFGAADLQVERALRLAEDVTSREARAGLYATLAKTEQERGDFDKATRLWRRSLDELDSLGWEQPVAETWNNLALVFRERNMPREARDALSRATQLAISTSHHRLRPWLELTRAQLVLDENKHAESEVIATAVIQDRSAPARARAEAQLILAEALADRKVPGQRIRKCFEDALVLAANQPGGVRARILRRYADALEAQGDLRGSVVRLREALELVRPETVKGTR